MAGMSDIPKGRGGGRARSSHLRARLVELRGGVAAPLAVELSPVDVDQVVRTLLGSVTPPLSTIEQPPSILRETPICSWPVESR